MYMFINFVLRNTMYYIYIHVLYVAIFRHYTYRTLVLSTNIHYIA